jgi:hypothetical protein
MAAETNMVGPGREPCKTCTGRATGAWFDSFDMGRSTRRRSPGFTDNPPMTKGCLTTALSTWDTTPRLRMKCTAVGRTQDRTLRILSNIGKQIFCASALEVGSSASNIAVHNCRFEIEHLRCEHRYFISLFFFSRDTR